jgi:hypothetical protein
MKNSINQPVGYKESLPSKSVSNIQVSIVPDHDGSVFGVVPGEDLHYEDLKPIPKQGEY